MRYTGQIIAWLGTQVVKEPNRGYSFQETWRGTLYALTGNANYFSNGVSYATISINGSTYYYNGSVYEPVVHRWDTATVKPRYQLEPDGAYYKATVWIPVEAVQGQDTPICVYKYNTEWGQDDVINAPKIQKAINTALDLDVDMDMDVIVASLYAEIKEAVGKGIKEGDTQIGDLKARVDFASNTAAKQWIDYMVWMLRKGVQAYEQKRNVLIREVTMSWNYWNTHNLTKYGMNVDPTDYLYTSEELATVFDIPTDVTNKFIASEDNSGGFTWGWKQRVNTADERRVDNKVVVNQEWVYAKWITGLYFGPPAPPAP